MLDTRQNDDQVNVPTVYTVLAIEGLMGSYDQSPVISHWDHNEDI